MILDLDFDYLVKYYPLIDDFGQQETPFFENEMWNMRFQTYMANPHQPLNLVNKITLDHETHDLLLELIESLELKGRWGVADSHAHAYTYMKSHPKKSYPIVHIDRHDDLSEYNGEGNVHGGNWLRASLEENEEASAIMIAQNKAELDKTRSKMFLEVHGREYIDYLFKHRDRIDYLFLCRSPAWTPPWLDKAFLDLSKKILDKHGQPSLYSHIKRRVWDYKKELREAKKLRKQMKHRVLKNTEEGKIPQEATK